MKTISLKALTRKLNQEGFDEERYKVVVETGAGVFEHVVKVAKDAANKRVVLVTERTAAQKSLGGK